MKCTEGHLACEVANQFSFFNISQFNIIPNARGVYSDTVFNNYQKVEGLVAFQLVRSNGLHHVAYNSSLLFNDSKTECIRSNGYFCLSIFASTTWDWEIDIIIF